MVSHESNINRVSPRIVSRSLLKHHNVDLLSYVNKFVIRHCNSHTIHIERGIQTSDRIRCVSLKNLCKKIFFVLFAAYRYVCFTI